MAQKSKRRKAFLFALVGLTAITLTLAIIARNTPKAFPELYELNPQVIDFKPDPARPIPMVPLTATRGAVWVVGGSPSASSIASSTPSRGYVPTRNTILVFPSSKVGEVEDAISKRFSAPGVVWYPYMGYFDGKITVNFMRGSEGDDMAKMAGVIQPRGGCIVTITEPAGWFVTKLHSVLHFLHLN
jgi:hypothetical protein